jgi:hypothetical protein
VSQLTISPLGSNGAPAGKAVAKTIGDVLLGGREVGLAEVEALRDGGVRPRPEVNVPHRALIELRRWFRRFLQDVER